MDNAILEYWNAIQDGSVIVGRWVRKLYERIVHGLDTGEYCFNAEKANKAIRFIERYVHHNKGMLAPQLLKLDLWQKAAVSAIFGIVDERGFRFFREVFLMVGRKCGKTLLAAAIIAYIAYVDGEFGSEIYCVAPKLEQADLVYSAFKFTADEEPVFRKRTKARKSDLYIKESNTTIKKVCFSEKRSDGYNPMLVVADEVASWPGVRGLKQWEVFISGMGARQEPLALAISSSGYEDEGIFDELFSRGTQWLNGTGREKHLLPILYMIDDESKWDDINELRKALPGIGTSITEEFIRKEIDVAYSSPSKKTEFMVKMANVKQTATVSWLKMEHVRKMFPGNKLTLEDFRGSYAIGGYDLSRSQDITAANVMIQREGICYVFTQFWMPKNRLKDAIAEDKIPYDQYVARGLLRLSGENTVDYEDVKQWFVELIEKYEIYVLQVGYDHWSANYLVQSMNAYGFHQDSVIQGSNLTGIINDTEGMIMDGKIQCADDNDMFKMHVMDSAMKMDDLTNRRRLVKITKRARIDGVAALLDTMCMRQVHWDELGGQLENVA